MGLELAALAKGMMSGRLGALPIFPVAAATPPSTLNPSWLLIELTPMPSEPLLRIWLTQRQAAAWRKWDRSARSPSTAGGLT